MPIVGDLAGALSGQGAGIAETAVKGLGTLMGGLNSLINPQEVIPPFIGMASSDFMRLGLATIMAAANTNLQFAQRQAVSLDCAAELATDISAAQALRQRCAAKFGAKAVANSAKNSGLGTKPTQAEIDEFYIACKRLVALQNTQQTQLKLYQQYINNPANKASIDALNFDFRGLLRKIIKGVGTIFSFAEKAKTIYEKAKPYLEQI